jgi:hypothetical protein
MKRTGLSWLALILAVFLAGSCGGSSSGGGTTPPPSTPDVTLTPSSITLARGATQQFTASVSGETDQTVQWEVNGTYGGDAVHGRISMGGVYIAPTTVPNPASVTVKAVSLLDPTKSGTATVTITTGSAISVVIDGGGAPLTVPTFGSYAFSATVTGTSNTALTWKVDGVIGGSATTGTISQSGVYYAPHSAPVSTLTNNDGQVTDVVVTAVSQADATASDSVIVLPTPPQQGHFPTPVPLGTSGGNSKDKSTSGSYTFCCGGTLGALVTRGGLLYVLSNNHVIARSDLGVADDPIIQPSLVDNNCVAAGTSTVATLSDYFNLEDDPLPNVDAALAEIQAGGVDPLGTIVQLGGTTSGDQPTDGTPNPGPGVVPAIGRLVAKSGSSTGLTCAPVLAIHATTNVQYQKGCNTGSTYTCNFTDQIDVGGTGFSALGDSGSLIVTQDTADPVGLLFAGSDSDTLANPVAVIISQLADKTTGDTFLFVGDGSVGPHPVAACSIPQPTPSPVLAAQALGSEVSSLSAGALKAAAGARDAHAAELGSLPGVRAVGVGRSLDNPEAPAVLLFVTKGQSRAAFPADVEGVRTRIVEVEGAAPSGVLSEAESSTLEREGGPKRLAYPVSDAEVQRARAVQKRRETGLMSRGGVQGVGIGSSLDSPGEAALIVFVIRGVARDPIPPVIDGLRTRIRESSRFRAR